MINVQKLPKDIEDQIYNYAFAFTPEIILHECFQNPWYLDTFVTEHSSFTTDQIDWFEFMSLAIDGFYKSVYQHPNAYFAITDESMKYRMILHIFSIILNRGLIKIDLLRLKYYHVAIRGFGGDGRYERLFDLFPEIENSIMNIIQN